MPVSLIHILCHITPYYPPPLFFKIDSQLIGLHIISKYNKLRRFINQISIPLTCNPSAHSNLFHLPPTNIKSKLIA